MCTLLPYLAAQHAPHDSYVAVNHLTLSRKQREKHDNIIIIGSTYHLWLVVYKLMKFIVEIHALDLQIYSYLLTHSS